MMKLNSLYRGIPLILTILFCTSITRAQVIHPDPGFVFDDAELPRIDLSISSTNLQAL